MISSTPKYDAKERQILYRVIISGDRNWNDQKRIDNALTLLSYAFPPATTLIVHGDCRGADKMVAEAARTMGYQTKAYPAKWKEEGKKAGPIRNGKMIGENIIYGIDLILIFHDNLEKSGGTKSFVKIAVSAGLEKIIRMCP